jgi:hypothetical protein
MCSPPYARPSDAHTNLRQPISRMTVTDKPKRIALLKEHRRRPAGGRRDAELGLQADDVFATSVKLAA